EATAFERVVTDRHLDLVGEDRTDHRAWKLRDMDLLVLRHEGIAGERVVMFPAGERSDMPDGSVHNAEARAIALPPDHPLMKRRSDLATLERQPPVRVEDQLRIVERSVVALVDAEHDHDVASLCDGGNGIGHRTGNDHRVLVEAAVLGAGDNRRMD